MIQDTRLLRGCLDAPTVVVDLDGTICETKGPELGGPKKGVRDALRKIQEKGYKIVVHSVRTASYWHKRKPGYQLKLILIYLDFWKIPYDYVFLGDKPIALYYIDNRAIRFEDNWDEIPELIRKPKESQIETWSGWKWRSEDEDSHNG